MDNDWRNHISVHCPHCDADFPARKSLAGGRANCPRCQKAVEVPGGTDMLFVFLVILGALIVLGVSAIGFATGGAIVGGIIFVVGALILLGICLAS